jgi:hypothetical protein
MLHLKKNHKLHLCIFIATGPQAIQFLLGDYFSSNLGNSFHVQAELTIENL